MGEQKVVVFRVGTEIYGLPIERVERILPEQSITKIPRTPKMLLGVFDLRGTTVPALDLRQRFEFDPTSEPGNFIVVQTQEGRCAVKVDSVEGIQNLAEEDIDPNTELYDRQGDDVVCGIGKLKDQLMVLLNTDEIVPKKLRGKVSTSSSLAVAA